METVRTNYKEWASEFLFRNNNPDKGTETRTKQVFYCLRVLFRNNNPDKGTETYLLYWV